MDEKSNIVEYSDFDGAFRLKQRLEEYWRMKGYTVTANLVKKPYSSKMRGTYYIVKIENMAANGMPPESARIVV